STASVAQIPPRLAVGHTLGVLARVAPLVLRPRRDTPGVGVRGQQFIPDVVTDREPHTTARAVATAGRARPGPRPPPDTPEVGDGSPLEQSGGRRTCSPGVTPAGRRRPCCTPWSGPAGGSGLTRSPTSETPSASARGSRRGGWTSSSPTGGPRDG